jgi:hypothetical protein
MWHNNITKVPKGTFPKTTFVYYQRFPTSAKAPLEFTILVVVFTPVNQESTKIHDQNPHLYIRFLHVNVVEKAITFRNNYKDQNPY